MQLFQGIVIAAVECLQLCGSRMRKVTCIKRCRCIKLCRCKPLVSQHTVAGSPSCTLSVVAAVMNACQSSRF